VVWIDLGRGYTDADALESVLVKILMVRRRGVSIGRRIIGRSIVGRSTLKLVDFGIGRLKVAFALTNFFGDTGDHLYDERGLKVVILEERTVFETVNLTIFAENAWICSGIMASLHLGNHTVRDGGKVDGCVVIVITSEHLIDVTRIERFAVVAIGARTIGRRRTVRVGAV
jgi:hypothetical protein